MEVTAQMLVKRIHCYSPIVHCHELAKRHKLPGDFHFWGDYNKAMIINASYLYLLKLDGWEDSIGIKAETTFALQKGLAIIHIDYPLRKIKIDNA